MKRSWITFALLVAVLSVSAQKKWTLQECLDYARQNNITLQKARLQQQQTDEEVRSAKSALLPSLSASTSQSVGYRPWQDDGVTTVTNGQVNAKVDKVYYNGSYGLNAQWTVWNGNRNRNNIRLSEVAQQKAGYDYLASEKTIEERINQLYVQLLYLKETIKVSEANLETAQKNEDRGREMVEVGKMSKADLAQLTAQRASDEYSVVEAQSQLASYILQLKQLLELTNNEPFDIAESATIDDKALETIPTLNDVYEKALNGRPEIQSAKLNIQSSDINLKIAKAGWLPSLNLSGGISTGHNSLSKLAWGNQMKSNFDAMAGLTLSVPIFDQRQTKTAVNRAKIQQQQAQLDLLDQQKQLYQTIETFWLDATTNQQKYRTARVTLESEQQSYDLLQEQFRLGLKNIVELMTGKDRLLAAQQNLLQSKYMTMLNIEMLNMYQH